MKLLVDRLSDSPTTLEFHADAEWWRALVERAPELGESAPAPPSFEVRAHRMGSNLYIEGTATGAFEFGCSRCLARYRHALREPFRLVLEPAGSRLPADPEAAKALARSGLCLGDELEAGWFQGSEIHLGPFFQEVITLALPVQPLCREECRGLCPGCGVDRNVESCGCKEQSASSPFAALGALRGVGSRGDS
jgi:uncharacterized protein